MSLGLWGPPGGDGRTKLRAQRGEQDAGIPESYGLLKSQERWEQNLEGTQTPRPRTLPPSEARSGSAAARRAPPRRWLSAGPAPRRGAGRLLLLSCGVSLFLPARLMVLEFAARLPQVL